MQFGRNLLGQEGGIDNIIQQFLDNDPNKYGTPPAAKQAIDSLTKGKVSQILTEQELSECGTDGAQCSVCLENFEAEDAKVVKMPCIHVFHQECLMPWLEQHNSCPSCRHELPTDDVDYENRKQDNGSVNELLDLVRETPNSNQNQNTGPDNNESRDPPSYFS